MSAVAGARRLTVDTPKGARVAVVEHAPADGPGSGAAAGAASAPGPTLVLAHGWCLTHEAWDPVVAALQSRRPDLRIVRYDQPGHGDSTAGRDREVSLLDLGAALRAVIQDTAPEGDLVLAGHSMGGMTIMALGAIDPALIRERVRGVALVGTAARLPGRRGIPGERLAMAVLGRLPEGARGLPTTPRLTAANLFGVDPDPEAVRATARMTSRTRARSVADWYHAIMGLDLRAGLTPFASVPTEILTGTRDRLTPVSAGRRLAEGIPGATFRAVTGVGHMITYEASDLVTARIESLLDAEATSQRA